MEEQKNKILIIEDDKFFRDLLTIKFQKENFEVKAAAEGKEAMEILKTFSPSFIIMDLILPGLNGYELLALVKQDPAHKNVPVLVLSNLGDQEEVARVIALGAVGFMTKVNFTLEEIVARVRKFLI